MRMPHSLKKNIKIVYGIPVFHRRLLSLIEILISIDDKANFQNQLTFELQLHDSMRCVIYNPVIQDICHLSSSLVFSGVRVAQTLVSCVLQIIALFVSFFLWPLCCLSFNLQFLIIILVSSNFSFYEEEMKPTKEQDRVI